MIVLGGNTLGLSSNRRERKISVHCSNHDSFKDRSKEEKSIEPENWKMEDTTSVLALNNAD